MAYRYDPAYVADIYNVDVHQLENYLSFVKFKETDTYKTLEKYSDNLGFVGGIFGAISNLFFIVMLLNIKGSLKSSLKLLLSLAVSDLCQSSLYIMMRYIQFDTYWRITALDEYTSSPVGYVVKRFISDLYFLSDVSGHVILVVMAADIFLAVRNPLSYQSLMSKRRGNILIVCIWIFCYLLVATSTLGVELLVRTTNIGERYFGMTWVAYMYLYNLARELNSIFFLAILCIYISIVIQVNRQTLRSLSVAKHIKMALVLGVIAVCYMVCSCPFGTTYLAFVDATTYEILFLYRFRKIQFVSNSFRGFFNSIIYAARIPEVQRQIRRFWTKRVVTRASTDASTWSTTTTITTAPKCVNNSQ